MVIIQLVDDSDYSPFWIFHRWRLHVDMIAKSCRFAYFCIFSLVGFQSIFNHSLNEWWLISISHWLRRFEHSFADSMLIQSTFRRVGYLTIHFQLEFAYSNTIWTVFFQTNRLSMLTDNETFIRRIEFQFVVWSSFFSSARRSCVDDGGYLLPYKKQKPREKELH